MPFTFNITHETLVNPKLVGGAFVPSEDEKYITDNFSLADDAVPDQYRFFSSEGSCGPSCRAYVTRLVTAKLAGTGLVASIAAQSQTAIGHYSWTCGLSAAVNFIATMHYIIIVLVRSQIFPKKYETWSIQVDRNKQKEEREALRKARQSEKQQVVVDEATQVAIYVQESIVDSLRFSDWVATLVLMTLALGADRDKLYKDLDSVTTPTWKVSPWWLAALQVAMVSCGSWWRFYANEGRGKSLSSQISAAISFAIGVCIFVVIAFALLDGLWPVINTADVSEAQINDAILMHILVLVWTGYPIVYVWSYFVNWDVPLGQYSSRASLGKDIGFGTLDVTSKGGLAIYSAMRCLI